MMLLVATTGPPLGIEVRVVELDIVTNDAEDDEERTVEPDSLEARGPRLIPPGKGSIDVVLFVSAGAVYMRVIPGP